MIAAASVRIAMPAQLGLGSLQPNNVRAEIATT
jgi:hypothetical protein